MAYIDKATLVKAIVDERDKIPLRVPCSPYELSIDKSYAFGQAQRSGMRKALRCVEQAPTADVVEVVRCKDCDIPHNKWLGCPNLNGMIPPPGFYCAKGIRKKEGGEG